MKLFIAAMLLVCGLAHAARDNKTSRSYAEGQALEAQKQWDGALEK